MGKCSKQVGAHMWHAQVQCGFKVFKLLFKACPSHGHINREPNYLHIGMYAMVLQSEFVIVYFGTEKVPKYLGRSACVWASWLFK